MKNTLNKISVTLLSLPINTNKRKKTTPIYVDPPDFKLPKRPRILAKNLFIPRKTIINEEQGYGRKMKMIMIISIWIDQIQVENGENIYL